jgi:hypothetical protein
MKMSQLSTYQFSSGFFTTLGAVSALALLYPVYHTSQVLCSRLFRKRRCKTECVSVPVTSTSEVNSEVHF